MPEAGYIIFFFCVYYKFIFILTKKKDFESNCPDKRRYSVESNQKKNKRKKKHISSPLAIILYFVPSTIRKPIK